MSQNIKRVMAIFGLAMGFVPYYAVGAAFQQTQPVPQDLNNLFERICADMPAKFLSERMRADFFKNLDYGKAERKLINSTFNGNQFDEVFDERSRQNLRVFGSRLEKALFSTKIYPQDHYALSPQNIKVLEQFVGTQSSECMKIFTDSYIVAAKKEETMRQKSQQYTKQNAPQNQNQNQNTRNSFYASVDCTLFEGCDYKDIIITSTPADVPSYSVNGRFIPSNAKPGKYGYRANIKYIGSDTKFICEGTFEWKGGSYVKITFSGKPNDNPCKVDSIYNSN